jgi:sulfur carrier protein
VIALQINGKRVELDGPTLLLDYLSRLGVDPRLVAVEHNGGIVERAGFAGTILRDGDVVEIVRMVGGGRAG